MQDTYSISFQVSTEHSTTTRRTCYSQIQSNVLCSLMPSRRSLLCDRRKGREREGSANKKASATDQEIATSQPEAMAQRTRELTDKRDSACLLHTATGRGSGKKKGNAQSNHPSTGRLGSIQSNKVYASATSDIEHSPDLSGMHIGIQYPN